MQPCKCSLKALEIFFKDVSGLTLRAPARHPRIPRYHARRHFGSVSRLNGPEMTPDTSASNGDEFVPFENEANSKVKAANSTNAAKVGRKIHRSGVEDEDNEWHAEIEILAPWPQETGSLRTGEAETAVAAALESEPSALLGEKHEMKAESVEEAVLLDRMVEDGNEDTAEVEGSSQELESAEKATDIAPQRSKAANRLERKARRVRDGTFRRQAEARAKDEEDESQLKSAMQNIDEMEDVDGSPQYETVEQPSEEVEPQSSTTTSVTKSTKKETAKSSNSTSSKSSKEPHQIKAPAKRPKSETWQTQKAALQSKFGTQGWSPRKRLSPDTISGIRALHSSDPSTYPTAMLAEHFKVTPEAIRRILKSKWRPNEEEVEDRRQRWERRGEMKWRDMAAQGTRPPRKWREKGIRTPEGERKRVERLRERGWKKGEYVVWEDGDVGGERVGKSLAGRIL